MNQKTKVIFVCTHNSARSQMAHGLLQAIGGDAFDVYSAGTESTLVKPFAIQALADSGIDISHHTSDHIDKYMDQDFDYVITVCDSAHETCPYFPATKEKLHWSFEDPSNATGDDAQKLQAFIESRKLIEKKLRHYFNLP